MKREKQARQVFFGVPILYVVLIGLSMAPESVLSVDSVDNEASQARDPNLCRDHMAGLKVDMIGLKPMPFDTNLVDFVTGKRFLGGPSLGLWHSLILRGSDHFSAETLVVWFGGLGAKIIPPEGLTEGSFGNPALGRSTNVQITASDKNFEALNFLRELLLQNGNWISQEMIARAKSVQSNDAPSLKPPEVNH